MYFRDSYLSSSFLVGLKDLDVQNLGASFWNAGPLEHSFRNARIVRVSYQLALLFLSSASYEVLDKLDRICTSSPGTNEIS